MTVTPILCDPIWVSACCKNEVCALCGQAANAKVIEVIQPDDPFSSRRAMTGYLCSNHFLQLMGPSAVMSVEEYRNGLLCDDVE
jgi:hypothetical protein